MTGGKTRKFCPVGKVFDGVKVIVFDENMKQMPIGMPGEVRNICYQSFFLPNFLYLQDFDIAK